MKLAIAYSLLLLLFTALMIGVHLIPRRCIVHNVQVSASQLQRERIYERKWGKSQLFKLDNYTDALMLNLAVTSDAEAPVEASMLNYYYESDDWRAKAKDLEAVATGYTDNLEYKSYGRYWQGHQVILRPLLCWCSYSRIRKINHVLLWLVTLCCLCLIWKRIGMAASLLFLIALLRVNLPLVGFSMQYSVCFYLMLLGVIAVLLFPWLTQKADNRALTFFVLGAVTVFFDFLTTPQLTLGLPLIMSVLLHRPDSPCRQVIAASLSWGAGYGTLWASKWGIGFLLTGRNIFSDAMQSAEERLSSDIGDIHLSLEYIWEHKISMPEPIAWCVVLVLLLGIFIWCWQTRERRVVLRQNMWLLLVALIVPVWFCLLKNHSFEHLWFTQRAFLLSLYAFMLWVYNNISANVKVCSPNAV